MNLKKLTLAAAVAASCAAPAFAQSSVQLYGKLYPFLLDERGSGATAAGTAVSTLSGTPSGVNGVGHTLGMAAGNSRLGFRGTEDLGGGLKAFFQLEGVASADDGTGNGHGAFQFNRNTFVGLGGAFGTIKLGNHDTIFKEYGDTLGVLGLSSGTFMSTSDVLRKTGFGTSGSSSFHLRRPNSIVYETPEIADFQFGYQYSTDEVTSGPRKPRLQSFGVRYDNGPIYVALAHEIHWDFFGGSRNAPSSMRNNGAVDPTHSKDQATEFVVEYRLGKNHKFEFDAIRKVYKESATVAGRFQRYKNMAYLLNMENRWSEQWRTAAYVVRSQAGSCTRVAALCTTEGLEGTKYTAAVGYSLSKRTMLFAAASLIRNGKSARYDNTEFSGPPNPGEDIRHFAVGVSHNF
jgi:predicted porin